MTSFQKILKKFFLYSFTGISVGIVVLGINRAKQTDALAANPPADQETSKKPLSRLPSKNLVLGQSVTAKLGVSGQFTGNAYKTPWGNAAASITVKNGKITAVTMPQVPNSPPSTYAEPYLVDQALRRGNANIQGVSGATYTSLAFKSSLESALVKASTQGTVTTSSVNTPTSAKKITSPSYPRRYRDDDELDD